MKKIWMTVAAAAAFLGLSAPIQAKPMPASEALAADDFYGYIQTNVDRVYRLGLFKKNKDISLFYILIDALKESGYTGALNADLTIGLAHDKTCVILDTHGSKFNSTMMLTLFLQVTKQKPWGRYHNETGILETEKVNYALFSPDRTVACTKTVNIEAIIDQMSSKSPKSLEDTNPNMYLAMRKRNPEATLALSFKTDKDLLRDYSHIRTFKTDSGKKFGLKDIRYATLELDAETPKQINLNFFIQTKSDALAARADNAIEGEVHAFLSRIPNSTHIIKIDPKDGAVNGRITLMSKEDTLTNMNLAALSANEAQNQAPKAQNNAPERGSANNASAGSQPNVPKVQQDAQPQKNAQENRKQANIIYENAKPGQSRKIAKEQIRVD